MNGTGKETTANGYKYTKTSHGSDYMLEIDLNRPYVNEEDATFYTVPYDRNSVGTYSFQLSNNTGDRINLSYDYSFADVADSIKVSMQDDSAGDYVQVWDIANQQPAGTYIKASDANGRVVVDKNGQALIYSQATSADAKTYAMETEFAGGGTLASVAADYAKQALSDMLNHTEATLTADDYSTLDIGGEEKSNVAVQTVFDSVVNMEYTKEGLRIQHSGEFGDETFIPRFSINASVLGMSRANVLTEEAATKTIDRVSKGIAFLSKMRSIYGAYQNRLEHTYAGNSNTQENLTAAESRIRDTDMAEEMLDYSKNNILQQAAESFLAQNMQTPEGVLRLLQ